MDRLLIIYAVTGHSDNLDFFLRHGRGEDADYVFVGKPVPGVSVIEGAGSRDGLWCRGLRESIPHKHYLLLSDEVRGPLLPMWTPRIGWSKSFTDLLKGDVKLGGSTISYSSGFRVDPTAMILDSSLVPQFLANPSTITAVALEKGNISCLMTLYQGRDFRRQRDPIYTTYHPFEAIFCPLSDKVVKCSEFMDGKKPAPITPYPSVARSVDQERREQEKREQERREQEKREQERREQEKRDQERREQERREQERREQEKRDQERREQERREQEKLLPKIMRVVDGQASQIIVSLGDTPERKASQQKQEQEQKDMVSIPKILYDMIPTVMAVPLGPIEKGEQERREQERREQERREQERREQERREQERREQERREQEKRDQERREQEKRDEIRRHVLRHREERKKRIETMMSHLGSDRDDRAPNRSAHQVSAPHPRRTRYSWLWSL